MRSMQHYKSGPHRKYTGNRVVLGKAANLLPSLFLQQPSCKPTLAHVIPMSHAQTLYNQNDRSVPLGKEQPWIEPISPR